MAGIDRICGEYLSRYEPSEMKFLSPSLQMDVNVGLRDIYRIVKNAYVFACFS